METGGLSENSRRDPRCQLGSRVTRRAGSLGHGSRERQPHAALPGWPGNAGRRGPPSGMETCLYGDRCWSRRLIDLSRYKAAAFLDSAAMADSYSKSRDSLTFCAFIDTAMKILSVAQAARLLGTDDLARFCEEAGSGDRENVATYALPKDSGFKVALARRLVNMLLERGPLLFWITGWGVWPSSEQPDVFYRYRLSLGESRHLNEAPVHLSEPGDEEVLISLLCIALCFVWGFEIVSLDQRVGVTVSHDEWLEGRISPEEQSFRSFFAKHVGLAPFGGPEISMN